MFAYMAIPIVLATGYLIIKKFNTQWVLFMAGLMMITLSAIVATPEFLPKGTSSSGAFIIDIFLVIKATFAGTLPGLGLIIMAAGGFSRYMNHIGAAHAMVEVSTKPLSLIKNPYIMLALAYLVGQILNIFIPSAAGLALLLLVAMYPALVGAGCNPIATASVLATTACLDLGPASGNSNKAAEVIGIDAASYFVHYQLPVAICVMLVIALLHFFTQRFFDKKDAEKGVKYEFSDIDNKTAKNAPKYFAILPVIPLALLLIFSKFAVSSIKIDVVTAMFIGLFISMIADFVHTKNIKEVSHSTKIFFQGMGDIFASVVSLLVAAQIFVAGLRTTGFIDLLLSASSGLGFGYVAMIIVLVAIIGLVAFLSGSGNAAFLSFSDLAPEVATSVSVPTAAMVVPMQLSAGIFRSMSPVAGVVIACAGVAGVSPIEVVKRTAVPMLGGVLTLIISTALFMG